MGPPRACLQQAAHAEDAKIRIGYPSGMNGQVPVVLEKAGIAAKHHLAAEFTGFQYGPPMMEGLGLRAARRRRDKLPAAVQPVGKAPGLDQVRRHLGQSSHSIAGAEGQHGQDASPISRARRSACRSIRNRTSISIVSLKEIGLDDKTDFELVNLQPNELPAALEKGLVDAVLIRQPQTLRLEESLGAKRIQDVAVPVYVHRPDGVPHAQPGSGQELRRSA